MTRTITQHKIIVENKAGICGLIPKNGTILQVEYYTHVAFTIEAGALVLTISSKDPLVLEKAFFSWYP